VLRGILCGVGAGALWGLVFIAPRMAPGFSSVDLTAGRFIAYGLTAAAVMAIGVRSRPWPAPRQMLAALGLSVLGFTGYYLLLVLAIRDAGTEVPALIIGTIPVWLMLLGKPADLRWRELAPGLALTAAGLALMMAGPQAAEAVAAAYWRGVAFALASLVCWTAFALANAAWLKRHPEVQATDWANWLGIATGLGALALWFAAGSPPAALPGGEARLAFIALCVGTGLGSAWLATVLWNVASRRLSASLCGQLIVSETVLALLYSFAWDGRWPGPFQFAACVLFTLGILASIKAHQ
jgi:drug/metabolite transporter (DMT)-like permease